MVWSNHGGGGPRDQLDDGFFNLEFGLFLQPLFLCQQHGSRELHVRGLPGCCHRRGDATYAGGFGPGFLQQSVQQHDSLRHGSGTHPVWIRLRGNGNLVEAGRTHQRRQYLHLDGDWWIVVESIGNLVERSHS